jgi:hypothetical protein
MHYSAGKVREMNTVMKMDAIGDEGELGTALCTRSHAMRWRIEETHHPGELGVSSPIDQSGFHTPFQRTSLSSRRGWWLLFAVCMHVASSYYAPVIPLTGDSR